MSSCICPHCGYHNDCDELVCVLCETPLRISNPDKFLGFYQSRFNDCRGEPCSNAKVNEGVDKEED